MPPREFYNSHLSVSMPAALESRRGVYICYPLDLRKQHSLFESISSRVVWRRGRYRCGVRTLPGDGGRQNDDCHLRAPMVRALTLGPHCGRTDGLANSATMTFSLNHDRHIVTPGFGSRRSRSAWQCRTWTTLLRTATRSCSAARSCALCCAWCSVRWVLLRLMFRIRRTRPAESYVVNTLSIQRTTVSPRV